VDKLFVKRWMDLAELNEYLEKELEHAGYGGMSLSRVPTGTRITLYVERPGAVIGKKGKSVQELTDELNKRFKMENPQVEVVGIEKPELNAPIMAKRIAFALERGAHFRSLGYTFMHRIMEAGARGVEIVISGKLGGERAKRLRFYQGYLSKAGEPAHRLVSHGYAYAKLKPGVVGVKVRIMPPVPTPDEIRLKTETPKTEETPADKAEGENGGVEGG
jgi:small subunit ribosomal protein S3